MKLSEKICSCRKKLGYSQETLAQELGVSRQAVSKWETGESEPEIEKVKRLAEVFHVTTDWLLSEEETEAPERMKRPCRICRGPLAGSCGSMAGFPG